MPNHTVHWINDHTEICDHLDARVQLMQDYLNSKPADFDGIAVKRFLLHQAREQVSWYRQSIDELDFVGCVALKNRIPAQTCYAILYEIEQRGAYEVTWGLADDGYTNTVRVSPVG